MSKQLTISATLSVLAMGAVAVAMALASPQNGSARGATAGGSLISVLLSA